MAKTLDELDAEGLGGGSGAAAARSKRRSPWRARPGPAAPAAAAEREAVLPQSALGVDRRRKGRAGRGGKNASARRSSSKRRGSCWTRRAILLTARSLERAGGRRPGKAAPALGVPRGFREPRRPAKSAEQELESSPSVLGSAPGSEGRRRRATGGAAAAPAALGPAAAPSGAGAASEKAGRRRRRAASRTCRRRPTTAAPADDRETAERGKPAATAATRPPGGAARRRQKNRCSGSSAAAAAGARPETRAPDQALPGEKGTLARRGGEASEAAAQDADVAAGPRSRARSGARNRLHALEQALHEALFRPRSN